MFAVGLTGGIGSGKSTVGDLLVAHGAVLIDADRIAREVVAPDGPAYRPVVERFGDGIVAADGTIDRAALAALVFPDPEALGGPQRHHPSRHRLVMVKRREDLRATDAIVVLDIPLLKTEHRDLVGLDVVVVVDCPARSVGAAPGEPAELHPRRRRRPAGGPADPPRAPGRSRPRRRQLVGSGPSGSRGGPGVGGAFHPFRPKGSRGGRPQIGVSHLPGTIARVPKLEVVTPLRPAGDQPRAIASLTEGITAGERYQTLLGITGSGKTATMAWTIEAVQRPTLIIEPNKSLAAQLASEMRELFPNNRVEYFVSYYDYYQPEAYLPTTDTYIEKDSSINDEIDRLRHATTSSLLLRRDVIVVASVSCIYGLGSPEEYSKRILVVRPGDTVDQRDLLRKLVDLHYDRNDAVLTRGHFRVRGDTVELHPAYEQEAVRIELFGDQVERIRRFDALTGDVGEDIEELVVFAATHYVAGDETMQRAIVSIEDRAAGQRLAELQAEGKLLEAQRLRMRTQHDLEMLAEVGVCNGIENYSRHLDGRSAGEPPYTLLDFFPADFLTVHRREPRGRPPDPRPVRRRPVAQADPGRARLPPPLGPRQPPAHLRRVHRARWAR